MPEGRPGASLRRRLLGEWRPRGVVAVPVRCRGRGERRFFLRVVRQFSGGNARGAAGSFLTAAPFGGMVDSRRRSRAVRCRGRGERRFFLRAVRRFSGENARGASGSLLTAAPFWGMVDSRRRSGAGPPLLMRGRRMRTFRAETVGPSAGAAGAAGGPGFRSGEPGTVAAGGFFLPLSRLRWRPRAVRPDAFTGKSPIAPLRDDSQRGDWAVCHYGRRAVLRCAMSTPSPATVRLGRRRGRRTERQAAVQPAAGRCRRAVMSERVPSGATR